MSSFSLKKYLPSKNFFLAVLGLAVGFVVVLVLMQLINRTSIVKTNITSNNIFSDKQIANTLEAISVQDSDEDGLKDWEESLWNTDPNSPDTDGDGINDKVEVEIERNQLQQQSIENGEPIDEGPLTATDVLARDLYTTMSLLEQQGTLADNQDLLQQKIAESVKTISLYEPISISNLNIVSTTSESVFQYISSINNLLTTYKIIPEEFYFVLESVQNNTVNDRMLNIESKYQKFADNLESMGVPIEMADAHMDTINAVRNIVGVLHAFIKTTEDPIMGMAGLNQLETALDNIAIAYQRLSDKIEEIALTN